MDENYLIHDENEGDDEEALVASSKKTLLSRLSKSCNDHPRRVWTMSIVAALLCGTAVMIIVLWYRPNLEDFGEGTPLFVCDPKSGTPPLSPMGTAKGIHPGRVTWSFEPNATLWDGESEFWWSANTTNQTMVDSMLSKSIQSLSLNDTDESAWDSIFRYFNSLHGKGKTGYQKGEKIGIKVNLNTDQVYSFNNFNGLSPQVLKSLLRQLVYAAGVNQSDICVYDAARFFSDMLYAPPEGSHEEFPDVHYVDNAGGYGREKVQQDEDSFLMFSDTSVPAQKDTKLPFCATTAKYMIEVDNFRGHDIAGFTMSGKNWFGSIYRPDCTCSWYTFDAGHWCPRSLHNFVGVKTREMGTYNPLVDLLGHDKLGGNVVLFLSDALYGGPTEHKDPIALDSVAYDFMRNEPNLPWAREGCVDNYLHEGALANSPPSKTLYNPTAKSPLNSLGVHEHWNNAHDKNYTRNLGIGNGIELYRVILEN